MGPWVSSVLRSAPLQLAEALSKVDALRSLEGDVKGFLELNRRVGAAHCC